MLRRDRAAPDGCGRSPPHPLSNVDPSATATRRTIRGRRTDRPRARRAAARGGAAGAHRAPQPALLRARRAGGVRRRVRRAADRAAGAGGAAPRPDRAGLADPAGAGLGVGDLRAGRPPGADDEPGQRLRRARSSRHGRARRSGPRRRGGGLRVRAQDRRAGHEPPLRGPAAGAGGHPRRRPGRRGRHGQRRHDRRRPQAVAGRGPGRARGAGRGVHARRRVRGAQPAPGGGRSTAVRQPPQLGRGLVAPEGSRDHGESRAGLLGLPAGRGRRRARSWPATTRPWSSWPSWASR